MDRAAGAALRRPGIRPFPRGQPQSHVAAAGLAGRRAPRRTRLDRSAHSVGSRRLRLTATEHPEGPVAAATEPAFPARRPGCPDGIKAQETAHHEARTAHAALPAVRPRRQRARPGGVRRSLAMPRAPRLARPGRTRPALRVILLLGGAARIAT